MVADTILLRKKFSQASKNYDQASFIQKEVADELFARIKLNGALENVLDIGMGTGYLSQKIKSFYPKIKLVGLDLALGMLEKSRQGIPRASFVQADAKNLPFKSKSLDLVISSLAYQWVRDLNAAFREVKRVLKDDGKFYFTIFSDATLQELREVIFELSVDKNKLRPIGNLSDPSLVEQELKQAGFNNVAINLRTKRQYFQSVRELLNWLKLIGANRYWSDSLYAGLSARSFVDKISQRYEEKFKEGGKIFATFEVVFVEAQG